MNWKLGSQLWKTECTYSNPSQNNVFPILLYEKHGGISGSQNTMSSLYIVAHLRFVNV